MTLVNLNHEHIGQLSGLLYTKIQPPSSCPLNFPDSNLYAVFHVADSGTLALINCQSLLTSLALSEVRVINVHEIRCISMEYHLHTFRIGHSCVCVLIDDLSTVTRSFLSPYPVNIVVPKDSPSQSLKSKYTNDYQMWLRTLVGCLLWTHHSRSP